MRLSSALTKFVKELENSNYPETTIRGYTTDIKQFIEFLQDFKVEDISMISSKHANLFVEDLSSEDYAPRSISRKINALKLFDNFLYEQGLINEHFSDELKHPEQDQRELRILSSGELQKLREVIVGDVKYKAIIETLLQTGMGTSELAGLTIDDVVLVPGPKFGEVHVRNRSGRRIIPINNAMEKVIEEYLSVRPESESRALFITKNGKALHERNMRRKIKEYFKKAGISDVMVNDLRNTFIANQLMKGVSIGRVAYLVGYKNISSLNKFVKALGDKIKIPDFGEIEEV